MEVLDRVFDREDMNALLAVDLVDDRRQSGRLAGARGPRHEHEAARFVRDLRDDRRQAEFLEREDLERDGTDRSGNGAALQKNVRTEAREVLHPEREIELAILLERDLLLLRHDRITELLRVDGGE